LLTADVATKGAPSSVRATQRKIAFPFLRDHLVNSLPLTPGGIGVGETAFHALFKLTGVNGGAEALLCVRLWNISVGLLGLFVYLFGVRRIVYPYDEESLDAYASYVPSASTN
jgi:hypothetical protein